MDTQHASSECIGCRGRWALWLYMGRWCHAVPGSDKVISCSWSDSDNWWIVFLSVWSGIGNSVKAESDLLEELDAD